MSESATDRRRYRRVQAPLFVRPASALARAPARQLTNVSLGGLRAFTDETYKMKQRLEIELFLPDQTSVTLVAEVAWLQELPAGSPARYDVGMSFVEVEDADLEKIARVLDAE